MALTRIARHVVPPAAVLLSMGILFLNKRGLMLLEELMVARRVLTLAAAVCYLLRPSDRANLSRDESAAHEKQVRR